jgi:hypothetical protein
MSDFHSDALVFFGATGDLAYKKIFPALQAMVKRGHLNVPVIGVARGSWNLDRLKARAEDSLQKHGGVDSAAFAKLKGLILGGAQERTRRRAEAGVLPGHSACPVRNGSGATGEFGLRPGRPGHRREAFRA